MELTLEAVLAATESVMSEVNRMENLYGKIPVRIECGALLIAALRAKCTVVGPSFHAGPFEMAGLMRGIPVHFVERFADDEWSLVYR